MKEEQRLKGHNHTLAFSSFLALLAINFLLFLCVVVVKMQLQFGGGYTRAIC
jgi:hypothetical protein